MIYRILSQDSTFILIKSLLRSQALITNMEKEFRRVEQDHVQSHPQHNHNTGMKGDVMKVIIV